MVLDGSLCVVTKISISIYITECVFFSVYKLSISVSIHRSFFFLSACFYYLLIVLYLFPLYFPVFIDLFVLFSGLVSFLHISVFLFPTDLSFSFNTSSMLPFFLFFLNFSLLSWSLLPSTHPLPYMHSFPSFHLPNSASVIFFFLSHTFPSFLPSTSITVSFILLLNSFFSFLFFFLQPGHTQEKEFAYLVLLCLIFLFTSSFFFSPFIRFLHLSYSLV